ncbi:MAG: pilus assembly protein [Candidimonas sp.]|nr:MAG: pilus assembly protein [Candidimonas sp.]TAM21691.1 MAG: pilus assembly protein [Candidimonas sp.]TAM77641.1 MAG: pilus assembly protein [Candidimonas sp.]
MWPVDHRIHTEGNLRRPSFAATVLARDHPAQKPKARQHGASLVEFSIVAIPILLIGLGSVEVAQWFYVKQVVSIALLQAARAGVTQHAKPQVMETAFEQALQPLFASSGRSSADRLQRALASRAQLTGGPAWQIEILNPTPAAFHDFADARLGLSREIGLAAINNNYQAEQDQRYRAQGRIQGLGPRSGLSIYQANVLALRVTYLHEPVLPGMKALMRQLSKQTGSYADQAMARGGYLPISQELELTMQSHPVDWPTLDNRKVLREQAYEPIQGIRTALACHGLWCLNMKPLGAGSVPANAAPLPEASPPETSNPPDGTGNPLPGSVAGGASPDLNIDGLAIPPDDPACGVTLCCVEG